MEVIQKRIFRESCSRIHHDLQTDGGVVYSEWDRAIAGRGAVLEELEVWGDGFIEVGAIACPKSRPVCDDGVTPLSGDADFMTRAIQSSRAFICPEVCGNGEDRGYCEQSTQGESAKSWKPHIDG